MKKNYLFFLLLLCSFTCLSQIDTKLQAKVTKIQGKEVYILCEPNRQYEIIDKVNSSVAQMLGVTPTLSNMVNTLVDKAVNKERKGKVQPFDALVSSTGDEAILIKFTDDNSDQLSKGTVSKMQGKEVYVLCEPLREYELVEKVNSAFEQLIGIDPSIKNMVDSMVEKAVNKELNQKIGKFDAMITNDGEVAILVKFK